MKLIVLVLAFAVAAYADVQDISNDYLPPVTQNPTESADLTEAEPAHNLGADGYEYKTIRRLKYRHRRDVNELPTNEYLPPAEEQVQATEVPEVEPAHELAEDGYRYKTVRRLKYRHRRDVNELSTNEYLPPVADELQAIETPEVEPAHELAEDGYRYKTVRRLKYRHRRDVSEFPSNDYLPPVDAEEEAPATEVPETEPAHELADDGYRYKTVRRIRYRYRRDVNELPTKEYLPPAEEQVQATEVPEVEPAHELAEDGYRYKTVRRLKYRHRRDVNELATNEYLPPVAEELQSTEAPEVEPAHELAEDGYRYKTVRRLKYRHRRDVNELAANEYLPPVAEEQVQATEVPEVEPAHELAEDGYRYKTVRRLKYRHRRDVNELPSNDYLPPAEEEVAATEVPDSEPAHELAEDGYRYKTVRRLKYRRRY